MTDIITDKTVDFLEDRDKSKPFFVMCHHKAPHRAWEYDTKYKHLYQEDIKVPETFSDDYKNRAKAAEAAKMRVAEDMTVSHPLQNYKRHLSSFSEIGMGTD